MNDNTRAQTRKLTFLGMMAAVSILLVAVIHFPIFPAAHFLEYDPADVPILFATFIVGPWGGLALTGIVSLIQGLTVSAQSGPIGIIMHFLATGGYVLVTGFFYRHFQKKHRFEPVAAIGLCLGALTMASIMVLCNLILTPVFMGTPMNAVLQMMVPIIIPFNLLKAGINGLITFIIYLPIVKIVKPQKYLLDK